MEFVSQIFEKEKNLFKFLFYREGVAFCLKINVSECSLYIKHEITRYTHKKSILATFCIVFNQFDISKRI